MAPDQPAGRFAPSPSGDLHLGNLRTALVAYLFARTTGRAFYVRMEDLDRARPGAAARQLADLAALGLDWDGAVSYQSEHVARYEVAVDYLTNAGLTYECYCTRKEIAQSSSAPHGQKADAPQHAYPGTCRNLTCSERASRRADGRPPALRLRAGVRDYSVTDILAGKFTAAVDDFVLRRNDGVAAYNLAVVVDDAAAGVDQVVRGDDLLTSAPRQAYLASLLGLPEPTYAHVPLVLGPSGNRLAKRDGAVTLTDLAAGGVAPHQVLSLLAVTLGLTVRGEPVTVRQLRRRFDPAALPRRPWVFDPARLRDLI